jgi:hypothetical protein
MSPSGHQYPIRELPDRGSAEEAVTFGLRLPLTGERAQSIVHLQPQPLYMTSSGLLTAWRTTNVG